MNRPDIVYIGYIGGLGGEGQQVFTLATGTALAGKKTLLVLPNLPKIRELTTRFPTTTNLEVILTEKIKFNTGAQNPADVFNLLWQHRNAPVLHLHTGDICLPRMTSLALAILRPPHAFVTIHCPNPEMPFGSARANFWANIVRKYVRRVISPSEEGRKIQIAYGVPEQKAVAIHNGVDAAKYAGGNGATIRATLGLKLETPLVVYAARLYPQKRPLDAAQVFARVAAVRPDVHFAFIGSGPMEEEADAALRYFPDPARLHRFVQQDNIPDWLAASTIWLFPTEAENLSIAVAEATAAGCSIVSTTCPSNEEILTSGENAFLVPVGDVDAMTEATLRLLDDTSLRERFSANARKTSARFTRETMAASHLAVYSSTNA